MGNYIQLVDSEGKRVKSKFPKIHFSRRKAEIFRRKNEIRNSEIPSSDIVHIITKLVDPNYTSTLEISRWNLFGERMANEFYQEEIGKSIYQCY
jgi:hypothetical protein